MKTLTISLVLFLLFGPFSYSQNVEAKLGNLGKFAVKDPNNTDIFSVTHEDFDVAVNGNLRLINTTQYNIGMIWKEGYSFLHNYSAPNTQGGNTFLGIRAGNTAPEGSNFQKSFNTGIGENALQSLSLGESNTAIGYSALRFNSNGSNNSAFGGSSLYLNTIGVGNSSFGSEALYANTSDYNSGFGYRALYSNTSGFSNTAFGFRSLENSNGIGNTAFGTEALVGKTSGDQNTAVGYFSGSNITTGSNNITIGYNAQVPNNAGNNQVRIGNISINYAGIQVAWTVTSDRRWKENIQHSKLGLDFISKLNPVSYTRINDENHRTEYGLIAQELEEVLKKEGIENTGMLTITDEGLYELRYNDLIAPMIKAIQDLKSENDKEMSMLKSENEQLRKELDALKEVNIRLAKLEQVIINSDVKFSSNITK